MNHPEELDTDDIEELGSYIERRYPTEEIRIHDTETLHFGYWDKSTRIVSAMFPDHIQAAGYRVLRAGISTAPSSGTDVPPPILGTNSGEGRISCRASYR